MTVIGKINEIAGLIGNTPTRKLTFCECDLFLKLEYFNFSGSIKDRPAINIIRQAYYDGLIQEGSEIIESSSGNFAIAIAMICSRIGIKFNAVIDPVINKNYEKLLRQISYKVHMVTQPDITGGYLLTRLQTIREICDRNSSIYWTNQYENKYNYLSYFEGLGNEIIESFLQLDYLFVGVSTGGTITGLSLKLKSKFPGIKIIAVDIKGSVIFGGAPQKRYISGIGASITSPHLKSAIIDEIMYVSQTEVGEGCNELLRAHQVFAGASTGAVFSAIKEYFKGRKHHSTTKPKVLFLCTDGGFGYLDTVYDREWNNWLKKRVEEQNVNQ